MIDNNIVKLNDDLIQSLRVRPVKEKEYPSFITISQLIEYIKDNLVEKDSIVKVNNEQECVFLSNTQLKIKIVAKKMNNKNVTLIEGLEHFIGLTEATHIFAKKFACSVTIKQLLSTNDCILIQGYWVHELVDILEHELKVQKKFITVEDKLKLKKK